MLELTWRRSARTQLAGVIDYIAARDVGASQRIKDLIDHYIDLARTVPGMGRPGRVGGTRELIVHPNYIVIYRTTATKLTILRVLHSRQQYP